MTVGIYPMRVQRGNALNRLDKPPPVHAGRYPGDESSGPVRTACGRTLQVPLEVAPETAISCQSCCSTLNVPEEAW